MNVNFILIDDTFITDVQLNLNYEFRLNFDDSFCICLHNLHAHA